MDYTLSRSLVYMQVLDDMIMITVPLACITFTTLFVQFARYTYFRIRRKWRAGSQRRALDRPGRIQTRPENRRERRRAPINRPSVFGRREFMVHMNRLHGPPTRIRFSSMLNLLNFLASLLRGIPFPNIAFNFGLPRLRQPQVEHQQADQQPEVADEPPAEIENEPLATPPTAPPTAPRLRPIPLPRSDSDPLSPLQLANLRTSFPSPHSSNEQLSTPTSLLFASEPIIDPPATRDALGLIIDSPTPLLSPLNATSSRLGPRIVPYNTIPLPPVESPPATNAAPPALSPLPLGLAFPAVDVQESTLFTGSSTSPVNSPPTPVIDRHITEEPASVEAPTPAVESDTASVSETLQDSAADAQPAESSTTSQRTTASDMEDFYVPHPAAAPATSVEAPSQSRPASSGIWDHAVIESSPSPEAENLSDLPEEPTAATADLDEPQDDCSVSGNTTWKLRNHTTLNFELHNSGTPPAEAKPVESTLQDSLAPALKGHIPCLSISIRGNQNKKGAKGLNKLNQAVFQQIRDWAGLEELKFDAQLDLAKEEEIEQPFFASEQHQFPDLKMLEWRGGLETFPKRWRGEKVSWTGLTNLSVCAPLSSIECLSMIRNCPKLEQLSLHLLPRPTSVTETAVSIGTTSKLLRPRLLNTIRITSSSDVVALLDKLTPACEALWHLDLSGDAIAELSEWEFGSTKVEKQRAALYFPVTGGIIAHLKAKFDAIFVSSVNVGGRCIS
ncbi:hypothetical protein AX16_008599 [Volvariella volvacea WC 439]|nr:hypothetical protein AX16_008599 [Volvariella volvacea WC 439]